MNLQEQHLPATNQETTYNQFVLPFSAIHADQIDLVGGKAANLGEMTRAGLPVPPGFCITTRAYTQITQSIEMNTLLDTLATLSPQNTTDLGTYAREARTLLLDAPIPQDITLAIQQAYTALGDGEPVAVRSSATAEDLPFASFAGQQDTYLNIVGADAVLDAVRRCWASLWTDRAVSYRATNDIDPRTVRLAVIIQRMVQSHVAGVLFTANPLTGHRHQTVIDANPGLGEAVVSGIVNPDHFVLNTQTGAILERHLGEKRVLVQAVPGGGTEHIEQPARENEPCLSDEQLQALGKLGQRVEKHYQAPQDIEWAIDASGTLWLTQTRPITTLFPLPPDAPNDENNLHVYFSVNVAQGVFRPFTPLGISVFRLMASSVATYIGFPPRERTEGPPLLKVAAERLFFDFTPVVRTTIGRLIAHRLLPVMEAQSAALLRLLEHDPRLSLKHVSYPKLLRTVWRIGFQIGIIPNSIRALLQPAATRKRVLQLGKQLDIQCMIPEGATATQRLDKIEQIFFGETAYLLSRMLPIILAATSANALAGKLLGGLATVDERHAILRGIPYNPTTEMDLALWALAQRVRKDTESARLIQELPATDLKVRYQKKELPPVLQKEMETFLRTHGHRAVAEIDAGLPRWSEDPSHLFGTLANYLRLDRPEDAPDVQFEHGAREAEAMLKELTQRARQKGRLRGWLVGVLLRRVRGLMGLRERPKFYLVMMMARIREHLWPVAEELAQAGRIAAAEDIFFLSLSEMRTALAGTDMRDLIKERRVNYRQEMQRKHLPHMLLSDGTEPVVTTQNTSEGTLMGTPASAGRITAKARVILDPNGAHLQPGEILVAPSTDPGWTPLFLTAAGLVMEMGGAMSHGAVVAREYGIPAVVGLRGATELISDGQTITVDGAQGTVSLVAEEHEAER